MAFKRHYPRISFPHETIDFPYLWTAKEIIPVRERRENIAGSGKIETISMYQYDECRVVVSGLVDTDFLYQMRGWWSRVSQGADYKFSFDKTKTLSTTIWATAVTQDIYAPITPCVIGLRSVAGISVDDRLVLYSNTKAEVVTVASVGTSTVQLDDFPIFTWAKNSTIRHEDYYPSCVCIDDRFPIQYDGFNIVLDHSFKERL